MFEKLSVSQKKLINWLGFVVVIGIGLMLIRPSQPQVANQSKTGSPKIATVVSDSADSYTEAVERRLASILAQIDGVGSVDVYVTLERSSELVIAESITSEVREGETRIQKTPLTIRLDGGNQESPLILAENEPRVRGALIVATGATVPQVRYEIMSAVQTVLQIPFYKIEVLAKAN